MGTNKNFKSRFYLIAILVMSVVMLASFLGVTIAYIKGYDNHTDKVDTPYLALEYYYNNTKLSSGAITGEIDASGNATLKVNGSSVSLTALNINIKNSGNINGKVANVFAIIEYYNTDGTLDTESETNNEAGTPYISLTAGTDYTIENGVFKIKDDKDITLTKNGGNSSQIIKGITVDSTIASSSLKGKTFKMTITAEIAQEGYESIDASI